MATDKKQEDQFDNLQQALGKSEQFVEKNQKLLIWAFVTIMVVIALIFGYNKYVKAPRSVEAESQIFRAQSYFEKDSFNLALNGDGNAYGFLAIAEDYSSTPAGNLANYYSGLCYLYMNEYENAITYLKKFSSDDLLLSNMAIANIGDAYMQLQNYKEAAVYYKKATVSKTNAFSTPIFLKKAAVASEKAGDLEGALQLYKQIKDEYPSNDMYDLEKDKDIARVEMQLKK